MVASGIDPRALMSFRAVAMHGSFAAAARELGWTQPAISQHVTRLEEELGTAVVIRTVKGVRLTEAGARLLHHAQAIDERLSRAAREISALGEHDSRTVRVLAFPSACTTIVAPVMSELIARRGGAMINLELEQREPYEVTRAVRRGEADLAIVFRYDAQELPGIETEFRALPIGWDPLQLIVARRRGGGIESPRRLSEYAHERWVSGCPSCRQHFLRVAQRAGFVPDIRHATDDYMVVQELVARDMSVAVVPRLSLVGFRNPGVEVYDLEEGYGRELLLLMAVDEQRREVLEVARALQATGVRYLDQPLAVPFELA